jgi:hypothetical protein
LEVFTLEWLLLKLQAVYLKSEICVLNRSVFRSHGFIVHAEGKMVNILNRVLMKQLPKQPTSIEQRWSYHCDSFMNRTASGCISQSIAYSFEVKSG